MPLVKAIIIEQQGPWYTVHPMHNALIAPRYYRVGLIGTCYKLLGLGKFIYMSHRL